MDGYHAKIRVSRDLSARLCNAFYDELFRLIPMAEQMFRSEEHMQQMFTTALSVMLKDSSDPEMLRIQLRYLGARHRNFGILPLHIKVGRQAFLNAVDQAAPSTSEHDRAFFESAFDQMADAMMSQH
jgi:hemoglobin-like flavoprotein